LNYKRKGSPTLCRTYFRTLSVLALGLALSTAVQASKPDPDDYPLRIQIFKIAAHSRHERENKVFAADMHDYIDGMGGANLFENSQPRGFLFTYSCVVPLHASSGFETFPARWKKKEKVLEILFPITGRPWDSDTCQLNAEMRPNLAYFWKEDKVQEEAADVLKAWMVKHQFDPEKGQDEPLDVDPDSTGSEGSSSSQQNASR